MAIGTWEAIFLIMAGLYVYYLIEREG